MKTENNENEALNKTDVSSSVLINANMGYLIDLIKKEIINEQLKLSHIDKEDDISIKICFYKLDCLRKAQLCLELVEKRINPFTNQTFNK